VFSPEYLFRVSFHEHAQRGGSIRDIQETILILVLFVDAAHERSSWWQDLIHENEDGLLWAKLDALADDIDELADCKVCGY
jgi:hypothetical protein